MNRLMKMNLRRWIAMILIIVMLPWQDVFTVYAAEVEQSTGNTQMAEESVVEEETAGSEDANILEEETTANVEAGETETAVETAAVTEETSAEETTVEETIVEETSAEETTVEETTTEENVSEGSLQEVSSEEGDISSYAPIVYSEGLEELKDLEVSGTVTLQENTKVGKLIVNSNGVLHLNGFELTVNDEVAIYGYVYVEQGNLNCASDIQIENWGRLVMTDINDYVYVKGDFYWNTSRKANENLVQGELELTGNLSAKWKNIFRTGEDFKVTLSGEGRQEISLSGDDVGFGSLEILNSSEEGVYSDNFIMIDELNDHENIIHYTDKNAYHGYKLTEDTVIEGDLILCSGKLDLNNKKLTVTGNLIQRAGYIDINNGTLVVNGDYRIQTPIETEDMSVTENEEEQQQEYGISYGTLEMTGSSDKIYVHGDFVCETNVDHTNLLTRGKMYLYGDVTIKDTGSSKAFVPSLYHYIYLYGEDKQTVTFPEFEDANNSRINHLYCSKDEVGYIEFVNFPYVHGTVSTSEQSGEHYTGGITAGINTYFTNRVFPTDITFFEGAYIQKPLHILGNVKTCGEFSLLFDVEIDGNMTIRECDNKSDDKSDVTIPYYIGNLQINGDLFLEGNIYITGNGVIKLKGDMTGSEINCNADFIFNGDVGQEVDVYECRFSLISLENQSEEGVHSVNFWTYRTLNRNGNKLFFGENNGVPGWKLMSDETYNDGFVLSGDILDLNGHTLTVNGDFIQEAGTIDFNNGKLIINGNYYLQKKNSAGYITYSEGTLVMDDENDIMTVSGDFSFNQSRWVENILSNGLLQIGGNMLVEEGYFCASDNHKVILNGTKKQMVDWSGYYFSEFNINFLELKNTSQEGVEFTNDTCILEKITTNGCKTNGTISIFENNFDIISTHEGDVNLTYNGVISEDLGSGNTITITGIYTFEGDIKVEGSLILKGTPTILGKLEVTKDLSIFSVTSLMGDIKVGNDCRFVVFGNQEIRGKIEIAGNLNINASVSLYNTLIVNKNVYINSTMNLLENANMIVDGSLFVNSGYILIKDEKAYVYIAGDCDIYRIYESTGVLEVAGNLSINKIENDNGCKIIMSGTQLQTITVPQNAVITTLELLNESEEGVYSDNILNVENLITNGNKIKYGDFEGEIGWRLEKDTVIENDLVLLAGTLDLNGHKLTIQGDYIQQSGKTIINGGTLETSGDYRMQTITDEGYGISNAALIMNNENDNVTVGGTFFNQTTMNDAGALTDGVLSVYGDIVLDGGIFKPSENHTVVLCGNNVQSIKVSEAYEAYFTTYFNNIIFNCKEVNLINSPTVYGEVDDCECKINGTLKMTSDAVFANNSYNGDVVINSNSNYSVENQLDIYGNAKFSMVEVKGTINIYGNMSVSVLKISGGKVNVEGDFTANNIDSASTGNLNVKGNLIVSSCTATEDFTITLNGNGLQNVKVSDRCTLGTLELNNTSEEGVYSENSFRYKKLIRNGCRLTFGNMTGEMGWTLEEDMVYDGNLILIGDELNLNGHTLTINGNFVHSDGIININGGKLVINGNYISSETGYGYSRGKLLMDGETDIMVVNGEVHLRPYSADNIILSAGKLYVSGNISQTGNIKITTKDTHEIILNGNVKQTVTFDVKPEIAGLVIENTSQEGVEFNSDIFVSNKLSDIYAKAAGSKTVTINYLNSLVEGTFGGNLVIDSSNEFDRDVMVLGNLTLKGTNYLNGHNLNAGSLTLDSIDTAQQILYVEDGNIYVENTMLVQNAGILAMQDVNGYVKVDGNFNISSTMSHKDYLTAGTLEIAGDFNQINAVNFIATEEHITKLDGKVLTSGKKLVQQVNFANAGKTYFNTLILTRTIDDGYVFNCTPRKGYKDVIYEIPEISSIEKVIGVRAENITTTSIEISYMKPQNSEVSGYEIYRDGKLAGVTTNTTFTDKNLLPAKTYEYTISAFDINKNKSELSNAISFTTLSDNVAPEAVDDLGVSSRTGSSLTLSWGIPEDNSGIAYYNVYRNGVLAAKNITTTQYCDKGLLDNTDYYYVVRAVDIAGNESEDSNQVLSIVQAPEILSITTDKGSIISGNSRIYVDFANHGDYAGTKVKIEYQTKEGKWQNIAQLTSANIYTKRSNLYVAYSWNSALLKEERDCMIRVSITDAGGCTSVVEKQFYIDNIAPQKISGENIVSENGKINLNWDMCETADCVGYKVYRLAVNGSKTLLTKLDGREVTAYVDVDVKTNLTYTYVITAFDTAGNESEVSQELSAKVIKDEVAPVVTNITPSEGVIGASAQIQVSAYDNKAVTKMSIYYSKDDGEWQLIECKENKSNAIIFIWNTQNLPEGDYKLLARAWDADDNVSDDEVTPKVSFTIDHTGPEAIDAKASYVSASTVKLSWSVPEDEGLDYFIVEQLEGEEYKQIHWTNLADSYVVTGLLADTEYTFRIAAYDTLGNRGVKDGIVNVKTSNDMVQPVIKMVDVKRKDNTLSNGNLEYWIDISVNAVDNVGVDHMQFYISEDGTSYSEANVVSGNGKIEETLTYSLDVTNHHGKLLYIKCEVYDKAGNVNELPKEMPDGVIATYFVDNESPSKIMSLNVVGNAGSVELEWDESTAEDIESYNIYRADNGSGILKLIASDIRSHSYVDCAVSKDLKYEYKVAAVDENGNTGEKSDSVYTTVIEDKTRPIIRGIGPSSEAIGQNQTLEILVTDNAALTNVIVSYKEKDSKYDNYYNIYSWSGRESELYEKFEWNTEGLQSKDYLIKIEAQDASGNKALTLYKDYRLDNEAPVCPVADVISGNFKVNIQINSNKDADFSHYDILRRKVGEADYTTIASIAESEYVDEEVKANVKYYYKIIAYDNVGNTTESQIYEAIPGDVDEIAPKAYAPAYVIGLSGQELILDASFSSDNVGIVSYNWNLGDGSVAEGSRCSYAYSKAGTYIATLTVADKAGNTDSVEVIVEIRNYSDNGLAYITVTNEQGVPIEDASVYVLCGSCEYASLSTDSAGQTQLAGEPAHYTVMAYATGYTPSSVELDLSLLKNQMVTLRLTQNSIVSGNVEVHKMTIQEMIAAGVDLSAPSNYHTYTFKLTLAFAQKPAAEYVNITANANGVISGYGGGGGILFGGGYYWSNGGGSYSGIAPIKPIEETELLTEEPMLCYMHITESVSWLMDMYHVSVSVINNANSNFTLKECTATIDIPKELSLAGMDKFQSKEKSIDDIKGGMAGSAEWVIKGEESGSYDLNVDFNAVLEPFNVPVNATFTANRSFTVATGEGLIIYVYPEDAGYIGKNYFVQYEIYNGTGKDLYNFSTTMGSYKAEQPYNEVTVIDPDTGEKTVVSSLDREVPKTDPETGEPVLDEEGNQVMETVTDAPEIYEQRGSNRPVTSHVTVGGERYSVGVFRAGEMLYGTYYNEVRNMTETQTPDEVYYQLVGYWIEELEGENLGVEVIVSPVPSHISRYVYTPVPVQNLYADPIDASTGAFLENKTAISVSGNSAIEFEMTYNSMLTEEDGELGTGWYHNYESYIEDYNGQLVLMLSPGQALTFISDDMKNGIIYGHVVSENKIAIDPDKYYTGRFSCSSYGMEDYYINKNSDGSYQLYTPDDTVYDFDNSGKLIRIIDKDGNAVSLTRDGDNLVVKDDVSGTYLTIHYNEDGLVDEVINPLGNKASFAYDDEKLICFTDPSGNTNEYVYDDDTRIVKVTENGRIKVTNVYDEKGRVTSQESEAGTSILSYEDTDTTHIVTITDPSGNVYKNVMDGRYNCIESVDGNGNTYTYVYDPSGNMMRETDPLGNTTSYVYDSDGNLNQITAPNGAVTHITTDVDGNITKVSDLARTEYFTYDSKNRLIKSESENGAVKTYEYDSNGKLTKTTEDGKGATTYGYTNGRMTSVTSPNGSTSHMEYDAAGRMIRSVDALGNVTKYEYDAKGYTSKIIDPIGNVATYEYDPSGNIIKAVNALGGVMAATYDDAGNQTSVTDVLGNTTSYIYDGAGNLIKTAYADGTSETSIYDGAGNVLSTTNVMGQTTTFAYDAVGNLISTTDHTGLTTSYEYDSTGKLIKQSFADGTSVAYTYDIRGNCIKEKYSDGTSNTYTYDIQGNLLTVTDAEKVTIKYTYDLAGQVIAITDGNGNTTRFAYDKAGNCISKTGADKTTVKMAYDALGRMTCISTVTKTYGEIKISYEYDALGRVTRTIDEMGNVNTCEYDALGRLVALKDAKGNTTATYTYDVAGNLLTANDAEGNKDVYSYNKKTGELISLVQQINTENQAVYGYEYDTAGRITKVIDALGGVTSQTYDTHGNISTITDANGGTTVYDYDKLGRLIEVTNAVGSKTSYTYNAEGLLEESTNARNQKTAYEYDKNGRISKKTDEAGTISYFYDNNGNVLTVTEELPDGTTKTINRTYDCMNRVSTQTDCNGNTVKYSYDELGNLITLTYPGGEIVRYEYYPTGWMKSVTDIHGSKTTYEYDSNGQVTKTVMGDGTVEECQYNSRGLVTVRETKNAAGAVLSRYEYTYDAAGNVSEATGFEGGDPSRLTSSQMTYDAANRLTTYNGKEVKYDADGNMTYGPLNGEMVTFTYDCRNRLVKAADTTYEYDAENTRTAVETSEYREEYVVNTNTTYSQTLTATRTYKNGAKVVTTYTYGMGLVSQHEEKRGTEYYHYDNLGSTTYLTKNGVKTETFAYGTYGELLLGESGTIRFLYNGRFGVATDNNNLYYMRARYYNVDIKRFINQDIIIGEITNSQSLNRYAYCQGNPVNYMDPFGLSPQNIFSAAGHAILNVLGFMPGGEVFDLVNAIWYAIEGNWTEAMICFVGAVPLLGTFAEAHNLTKLSKGLKFASNAGKMYIGGAGAKQNLDNIYNMLASGTGQWYDYLREGGEFVLNVFTCAGGTVGVIDGLNDAVRQMQKVSTQNLTKEMANQTPLKMDLQFFGGKSGRETELFLPDEYYQKLDDNIAKAIAARDAEVARIQGLSMSQQRKVTTVVAGVDLRTGKVVVAAKKSEDYGRLAVCAEDIVYRELGGNVNANIIMTPAIRPRSNDVIPVCGRCQTKYPVNQFVKGTTFSDE